MEFRTPFSAIVAGPSSSGKSHFVVKFLKEALIVPVPRNITWYYSVWQELYESITNVHFVQGLPVYENCLQNDSLIVIDDQLDRAQLVTDIYTKFSHHKRVSVIFITQNFFYKGMRTITLNAQFLFLFRNPRDSSQIGHLARQMFPGNARYMIEAYQDATSKPFSYLLVDLRTTTKNDHRLRTGIFIGEEQYFYLPK